MCNEEWEFIPGYEGIVQASTHGNFRTVDRMNTNVNGVTRMLKGQPLAKAYNKRNHKHEVSLNKNNKRKSMAAHVAVARTFIENDDPEVKLTVNHKDGDRLNNVLTNLEWASYSENLKHSYDELNRPVNIAGMKSRKCLAIDVVTDEPWQYDSVAQTSRETKISETQVRRIATGECVNLRFDFYIQGINEDFC